MTNNKNFFKVLNTCTDENITLANGDNEEVKKIGDGYLTYKGDKNKQNTIVVKEVLYIPTLEENLLSVRKLIERGLQVKFTENVCNIVKYNEIVASAILDGNLYRLQFDHKALMVIGKHKKDCQHTWHRKLGHRDPEAIKHMEAKDLVAGLKVVDCGIKSVCETCIKGKMTRKPFPKNSTSETKEPLDLVQTSADRCKR